MRPAERQRAPTKKKIRQTLCAGGQRGCEDHCCQVWCGRIYGIRWKAALVQQKTNNGDLEVIQVSTTINVADAGAKALTASRLKGLLYIFGAVQGESFESVGEMEHEQMTEKMEYGKQAKGLAKTMSSRRIPIDNKFFQLRMITWTMGCAMRTTLHH